MGQAEVPAKTSDKSSGLSVSLSKRKLKNFITLVAIIVVIAGAIAIYWTIKPKPLFVADPEGDFETTNMDLKVNPDPYPMPYADIKKISFKVDDENLTVRWDLWGEIPKTVDKLTYNGDLIESVNYTLSIDTDSNLNTGQEKLQGREIMIQHVLVGQAKVMETWIKMNDQRDETSGFVTSGGPGHNYLVGEYPLSVLGLKKGQKVIVTAMSNVSTANQGEFATADWLHNPHDVNGDPRYVLMNLGEKIIRPVGGTLDFVDTAPGSVNGVPQTSATVTPSASVSPVASPVTQ